MQKIKSFLLPGIFLVIILVGALLGYRELTKTYTPEEMGTTDTNVQPAPDFSVTDADGNTVSLSDYAGKPVVINFWATWCGPCQVEMPYFQTAWETYGEDVQFMMVNMTTWENGTAEEVETFLAEAGYTFPVYYDPTGECAVSYGITGIPVTIFVDADGNVTAAHQGTMSESVLKEYMKTLTEDT